MAELDAYGRSVSGFKVSTILTNGAASIGLGGAPAPNAHLHPVLHLSEAETMALFKALAPAKPKSPLIVGLDGLSGWGASAAKTMIAATGIAATRATLAFKDIAAEVALLKEALAYGCRPYLLYDRPLAGRTSTLIAGDYKTMIALIDELDLEPWIEDSNEPYWEGATPESQAAQYRAALEACTGSGITPAAKAWGDYEKPNGEWSAQEAGDGWCADFCKALGETPPAWALHAYGPITASDPFGSTNASTGRYSGWASIPPLITFLKTHGIYAPVTVTEAGQRSGAGSDGGAEVTEATQAANYKGYIEDAVAWGLAGLFIYEAVDTGEGGYGLYKWPLEAKPSVAAVAEAVRELA